MRTLFSWVGTERLPTRMWLSVFIAAIRQWITAPLLVPIRIKLGAHIYRDLNKVTPAALLAVRRLIEHVLEQNVLQSAQLKSGLAADLPCHELMLSECAVPEAIADLTVHYMTLCGMIRCLSCEYDVGKFPRSGGFWSVLNLSSAWTTQPWRRSGRMTCLCRAMPLAFIASSIFIEKNAIDGTMA